MKVGQVWAVGRNYADHAKELGNAVPSEPMFFLKGGGTVSTGSEISWPAWALDVHHELELGLQFGADFRFARACLALDLTERTKQNELKAKGHPWTLAKSFIGSCPISSFIDVPGDLASLRLTLKVNGETRQDESTSRMIFSPDVLSSYARKHFPVEPGDLLLTGTPAGVGVLRAGDRLEGVLTAGDGRVLLRQDWNVKS